MLPNLALICAVISGSNACTDDNSLSNMISDNGKQIVDHSSRKETLASLKLLTPSDGSCGVILHWFRGTKTFKLKCIFEPDYGHDSEHAHPCSPASPLVRKTRHRIPNKMWMWWSARLSSLIPEVSCNRRITIHTLDMFQQNPSVESDYDHGSPYQTAAHCWTMPNFRDCVGYSVGVISDSNKLVIQ